MYLPSISHGNWTEVSMVGALAGEVLTSLISVEINEISHRPWRLHRARGSGGRERLVGHSSPLQ